MLSELDLIGTILDDDDVPEEPEEPMMEKYQRPIPMMEKYVYVVSYRLLATGGYGERYRLIAIEKGTDS